MGYNWAPPPWLTADSDSDLVPVPTKHEGWIVISKDLNPAIIGQWVYRTQQEADVARVNARYSTAYIVIPIYWED